LCAAVLSVEAGLLSAGKEEMLWLFKVTPFVLVGSQTGAQRGARLPQLCALATNSALQVIQGAFVTAYKIVTPLRQMVKGLRMSVTTRLRMRTQ
jgi:hypothetical protein